MKSISVACAIAFKKDKVLLCRRGPGENLAGFWEFPGGKLEPGEEPETAIERELSEELGLASRAGKIFSESIHHYDDFSIRLIALYVDVFEDPHVLNAHDKYAWVHPRCQFQNVLIHDSKII